MIGVEEMRYQEMLPTPSHDTLNKQKKMADVAFNSSKWKSVIALLLLIVLSSLSLKYLVCCTSSYVFMPDLIDLLNSLRAFVEFQLNLLNIVLSFCCVLVAVYALLCTLWIIFGASLLKLAAVLGLISVVQRCMLIAGFSMFYALDGILSLDLFYIFWNSLIYEYSRLIFCFPCIFKCFCDKRSFLLDVLFLTGTGVLLLVFSGAFVTLVSLLNTCGRFYVSHKSGMILQIRLLSSPSSFRRFAFDFLRTDTNSFSLFLHMACYLGCIPVVHRINSMPFIVSMIGFVDPCCVLDAVNFVSFLIDFFERLLICVFRHKLIEYSYRYGCSSLLRYHETVNWYLLGIYLMLHRLCFYGDFRMGSKICFIGKLVASCFQPLNRCAISLFNGFYRMFYSRLHSSSSYASFLEFIESLSNFGHFSIFFLLSLFSQLVNMFLSFAHILWFYLTKKFSSSYSTPWPQKVVVGGGRGSRALKCRNGDLLNAAELVHLGIEGLENTSPKRYCFLIAAFQLLYGMKSMYRNLSLQTCKCDNSGDCGFSIIKEILLMMPEKNTRKAILGKLKSLSSILVKSFPELFHKDADGVICYSNAISAFECLLLLAQSCHDATKHGVCLSDMLSEGSILTRAVSASCMQSCSASRCRSCGRGHFGSLKSRLIYDLLPASVSFLLQSLKSEGFKSLIGFENLIVDSIVSPPVGSLLSVAPCPSCSDLESHNLLHSFPEYFNLRFNSFDLPDSVVCSDFSDLRMLIPAEIDLSLWGNNKTAPSQFRSLQGIVFYGGSHWVYARLLANGSWALFDDDKVFLFKSLENLYDKVLDRFQIVLISFGPAFGKRVVKRVCDPVNQNLIHLRKRSSPVTIAGSDMELIVISDVSSDVETSVPSSLLSRDLQFSMKSSQCSVPESHVNVSLEGRGDCLADIPVEEVRVKRRFRRREAFSKHEDLAVIDTTTEVTIVEGVSHPTTIVQAKDVLPVSIVDNNIDQSLSPPGTASSKVSISTGAFKNQFIGINWFNPSDLKLGESCQIRFSGIPRFIPKALILHELQTFGSFNVRDVIWFSGRKLSCSVSFVCSVAVLNLVTSGAWCGMKTSWGFFRFPSVVLVSVVESDVKEWYGLSTLRVLPARIDNGTSNPTWIRSEISSVFSKVKGKPFDIHFVSSPTLPSSISFRTYSEASRFIRIWNSQNWKNGSLINLQFVHHPLDWNKLRRISLAECRQLVSVEHFVLKDVNRVLHVLALNGLNAWDWYISNAGLLVFSISRNIPASTIISMISTSLNMEFVLCPCSPVIGTSVHISLNARGKSSLSDGKAMLLPKKSATDIALKTSTGLRCDLLSVYCQTSGDIHSLKFKIAIEDKGCQTNFTESSSCSYVTPKIRELVQENGVLRKEVVSLKSVNAKLLNQIDARTHANISEQGIASDCKVLPNCGVAVISQTESTACICGLGNLSIARVKEAYICLKFQSLVHHLLSATKFQTTFSLCGFLHRKSRTLQRRISLLFGKSQLVELKIQRQCLCGSSCCLTSFVEQSAISKVMTVKNCNSGLFDVVNPSVSAPAVTDIMMTSAFDSFVPTVSIDISEGSMSIHKMCLNGVGSVFELQFLCFFDVLFMDLIFFSISSIDVYNDLLSNRFGSVLDQLNLWGVNEHTYTVVQSLLVPSSLLHLHTYNLRPRSTLKRPLRL